MTCTLFYLTFNFLRALQAIYNAGKARNIFYFRNGDALLFAITCAQVLYAYTVRIQISSATLPFLFSSLDETRHTPT
jgi:hypothetical protein